MMKLRSIHPMLLLGTLLFLACEREETPVKPYDRGDVEQYALNINPEYDRQLWFDLHTGEVIADKDKFVWDLKVARVDDSFQITLNGSKAMQAASTDHPAFDAMIDQASLAFRIDHPTGHPDSMALKGILDEPRLFVVDRGVNPSLAPAGYVKLRVLIIDDQTIRLQYGSLSENTPKEVDISIPDPNQPVAFSFETGPDPTFFPPDDSYDLMVTQYMHLFYEPYTPYLVTGMLINPSIEVAMDTLQAFEDIDASMLDSYTFTRDANAIGYDWKIFSFQSSSFEILTNRVYVIKDRRDFYYKLQFSDFYTDQGEKGNLEFFVQKL